MSGNKDSFRAKRKFVANLYHLDKLSNTKCEAKEKYSLSISLCDMATSYLVFISRGILLQLKPLFCMSLFKNLYLVPFSGICGLYVSYEVAEQQIFLRSAS